VRARRDAGPGSAPAALRAWSSSSAFSPESSEAASTPAPRSHTIQGPAFAGETRLSAMAELVPGGSILDHLERSAMHERDIE
jgi:hypothetical protein